MKQIREVLNLVRKFDKRGARNIIIAALIGAIIDAAGVASISPFLSLASEPEAVLENKYLSYVYNTMGFSSYYNFAVFIGIMTISVLIILAVSRAIIAAMVTFFMHWQRHQISSKLFEKSFHSSLDISGNQHSTTTSNKVFGETDVFIDSAVRPVLELIVHGTLVLVLTILLFLVNFWNTAAIILGIALFFLVVVMSTKNTVERSGKNRACANADRYRSLKEAASGALELKLLGREEKFFMKFIDASKRYARSVSLNQAIMQVATYLLQGFTFAGIVALTMSLMKPGSDLSEIVPTLGIFLFAGYRIMPAANTCYRAISTLRYAKPAISSIQHGLLEQKTVSQDGESVPSPDGHLRITLKDGIQLRGVEFSYSDNNLTLKVDDIFFPANKTIGIVGSSGSGKSTLLSLLLGLRAPQQGKILIDGTPLDSNTMGLWKTKIGFVSQNPFFSDETVRENIALGLEPHDIDDRKLVLAADLANASEFINLLPQTYDSYVGEEGGRLSGGQRQRIALARALYHDPDVIFLDEVTSSLDSKSETAISQTIANLNGRKTIFVIAHRPEILSSCDLILRIESGRIVSFEQNYSALSSQE